MHLKKLDILGFFHINPINHSNYKVLKLNFHRRMGLNIDWNRQQDHKWHLTLLGTFLLCVTYRIFTYSSKIDRTFFIEVAYPYIFFWFDPCKKCAIKSLIEEIMQFNTPSDGLGGLINRIGHNLCVHLEKCTHYNHNLL